jgi:hypothetical protein
LPGRGVRLVAVLATQLGPTGREIVMGQGKTGCRTAYARGTLLCRLLVLVLLLLVLLLLIRGVLLGRWVVEDVGHAQAASRRRVFRKVGHIMTSRIRALMMLVLLLLSVRVMIAVMLLALVVNVVLPARGGKVPFARRGFRRALSYRASRSTTLRHRDLVPDALPVLRLPTLTVVLDLDSVLVRMSVMTVVIVVMMMVAAAAAAGIEWRWDGRGGRDERGENGTRSGRPGTAGTVQFLVCTSRGRSMPATVWSLGGIGPRVKRCDRQVDRGSRDSWSCANRPGAVSYLCGMLYIIEGEKKKKGKGGRE